MNERVYISEIQHDLQYKDRRSVRRWCSNNNVNIISDQGSNKQFVLREEYELAKSKNYHRVQDPSKSLPANSAQLQKKTEIKKTEYSPRFKNEIRMVSILTNIMPTL